MSQDCAIIFLLSIILFQILIRRVDGAGGGECQHRRIECFDCDSRYDPTCEHIDWNNPNSIKPNIRMCSGCCVKMVHRYGNGRNYVQRTCTENLILNYFMVDHVCMSEGKQRGEMCFCEEHLCNNSPPSKLINTNYSSILLLLLSTLATITIIN